MRYPRTAAMTLASMALISCEDPTSVREASRLYLSPEALTLVVGDSDLLIARAVDVGGKTVRVSVVWSSANPTVVAIDQRPGRIIAVSAGVTTVTATAGNLSVSAVVSVRTLGPPASLSIGQESLSLYVGNLAPLTALAFDSSGRRVTPTVEWNTADASVASVGRTTGIVTGVAEGITTVTASAGDIHATATVTVIGFGNAVAQWATGATSSSEYTASDWSALQATGPPNVNGCEDNPWAWASLDVSVDWLEVSFDEPVRPSEIHIHEVWAVGAIVKVEVKDASGGYHTVYVPPASVSTSCPSVLVIPVNSVRVMVSAVRITVDQSRTHDWAEIDAVQLIGHR